MRSLFLRLIAGATMLQLQAMTVAVGAEPFFDQKHLFISGIDDVNIYRVPTLVVSPKGTILAFCEGRDGDDGDPTDLVLKRSVSSPQPTEQKTFNGFPRTFGYGVNWGRMQVVVPGKGEAIMQNTPVVDHTTGTIFLCCIEVRGGLKVHLDDMFVGRPLMVKSTDDGVSWSEPEDITPQVGMFVAGPSVGVQLASGRLVIPGYTGQGSHTQFSTQPLVIYSDDHGKTWKVSEPVAGSANESQVVELVDGTLMLNARRKDGPPYRYVALSRNGGETWHEGHHDKNLVDPICQGSLWRYTKEGNGGINQLLFSNPANIKKHDRSNLTVKLSRDEGKSWPVSRQVCAGPAAYSCLAILADGKIGLLYESGDAQPYERITFARFNLEWLTASAKSP